MERPDQKVQSVETKIDQFKMQLAELSLLMKTYLDKGWNSGYTNSEDRPRNYSYCKTAKKAQINVQQSAQGYSFLKMRENKR